MKVIDQYQISNIAIVESVMNPIIENHDDDGKEKTLGQLQKIQFDKDISLER